MNQASGPRSIHRRGFHAAVIRAAARVDLGKWRGRLFTHTAAIGTVLLLAACGNISCNLLGSNSLRQQCEDNTIIVPIYTVPDWYPGQDLGRLWQDDKAAQYGGLY